MFWLPAKRPDEFFRRMTLLGIFLQQLRWGNLRASPRIIADGWLGSFYLLGRQLEFMPLIFQKFALWLVWSNSLVHLIFLHNIDFLSRLFFYWQGFNNLNFTPEERTLASVKLLRWLLKHSGYTLFNILYWVIIEWNRGSSILHPPGGRRSHHNVHLHPTNFSSRGCRHRWEIFFLWVVWKTWIRIFWTEHAHVVRGNVRVCWFVFYDCELFHELLWICN